MGLEELYKLENKADIRQRKSSIDSVLKNEKFKGVLDTETIQGLLMDVDTNIRLKQVILSDENKNKLKQFLMENRNRAEILKYGLRPMNRILCYGASGCGKTFMGKALSNEMGYTLLYVDIAQSLSQGNVAINLTNIFRLANVGGCMVFLDECDSIAWDRRSKNAESGDVRRATNSLFQLMDQLNPDSIIMCATNLLEKLDAAFERRFDLKMEFRRPDLDLVEAILHFKKPEFELINDVEDDELQTVKNRLKTHTKLSYYEIQSLTERAMKKAIITKTVTERNNKKAYAVKLSWIIDDIRGVLKIRNRFTIDLEGDGQDGNNQ